MRASANSGQTNERGDNMNATAYDLLTKRIDVIEARLDAVDIRRLKAISLIITYINAAADAGFIPKDVAAEFIANANRIDADN